MHQLFKFALFLTVLSTITACGGGGSSTAPIVPPVQNTAPVANAGPDQTSNTGAVTTLNASASSDANGDSLTYQWSISSSPSGSSATLSSSTTTMPTFTADIDGTYVFQLIVNDGSVNSPADSVSVVASTPNTAPIANAGMNQTINTASLVTLNGTASTDIDGDTLTFLWSISSVPAGSNIALSNNTDSMPTFTADVDGSYVFQLIVNDGSVNSSADSVDVVASTPNTAPVASAGMNQNINTGALVTLDGTASSDINGDSLTYQWVLNVPMGSSASLNDGTLPSPTFTADIDGTYSAQLTVNDGTVNSLVDSVDVVATTLNSAPVANPGLAQNVNTGDLVSLDGSASSDVDGDNLSYQWTLVSVPTNSVASLNDIAAVSPTFTADLDGNYVVELIVNDGTVDSSGVSVTITATTANSAPMANAGNDQNAEVNDIVALNGSASTDADGDTITYQWSLLSVPTGSAASLTTPTDSISRFTPDLAGTYTAQLIVSDGEALSTPDTINVIVTVPNTAPVANAGVDQNINTGALVMLNGTASSDIDGDTLSYLWVLSVPTGSLSTLNNNAISSPSFTADVDGTYSAQLTVNDGDADSAIDSVQIVATTLNSAPVANAGVDQNKNTGSTVTLDGSASTDADGDNLSYLWVLTTLPSGSAAVLNDATLASPIFSADLDGSYVAELTVNDGQANSAADSVTITASTANSAPVANAGNDQNVVINTLVTLDGSASSDANNDAITYQWSFLSVPAGNTATLSNFTSSAPSFTPNVEGTYTVQLLVNDGQESSVADTVNITVTVANAAPVANAGSDQLVTSSTIVMLDGTGSSDANNDSLTYTWSFVSVPTGSTATFDNNQISTPSFTVDLQGSYVVSLVVSDGTENSVADAMQVNVSDTTITLTRKIGIFGNNFASVDFPYSSTISLNTDDESDVTLNTFRITAQGGNVTINNLQAVNQTNALVPLFTTISEGFILNDGATVEFDLMSPLTGGIPVSLSYTFEIAETGQTFSANYLLTTSN